MYPLGLYIFLYSVVFVCGFPSANRLEIYEYENNICITKFCNATNDYPEGEILKALSRNSTFNSMFGNVITPMMKISTRFAGDHVNMCPSKTIPYRPRAGVNINGEERNIVNVDGHVQQVTMQICEKDAKCFANSALANKNLHFECQTQFVTIRLVVAKDSETLDVEHFRIPSGCYCSYKNDSGSDLNNCAI